MYVTFLRYYHNMSYFFALVILYFIGAFAGAGLQNIYLSITGLNGMDSHVPNVTNWIQTSDSIFALPLGKCLQCNLFWCKFVFIILVSLLSLTKLTNEGFAICCGIVALFYVCETVGAKYFVTKEHKTP